MTTQAESDIPKNVCVKKVTDAYNALLEGPHWDNSTKKLYFVDPYNKYIRRLDPATGVVTSAYVANGPIGVAVPVKNSIDQLVAGIGKDIVLITWDGNSNSSDVPVDVLHTVEPAQAQTRFNDGKVDSTGRLWIGTMGTTTYTDEVNLQIMPNKGTLYCVDSDFKSEKQITLISISNGMAWSIEDNTYYYIDSATRQIAAYDYDPNSGTISNKRIAFDLDKTNLKGLPDGMTIDSNGYLWIALYGGYQVIQVDPKTGELLRKVEIPVENVTSVAFGGPLLDILYVTTSGYNLTAEQRKATPDAGAIFAVTGLGVRGLLPNTFVTK